MVWLSCKSFWEINTLSAGMPLTPNLLESWSTRGSPKGTANQLPSVKGLGVPYLGCSWNISLFRNTVFTKYIWILKELWWRNLWLKAKNSWFSQGTNHEPPSYNPFEPLHCGLTTQRSPPPGCLRLNFQSKKKKNRAGYLLLHLASGTCPRVAVRPGWETFSWRALLH